MLHILVTAVNAIAPIIGMILLGYLLRQKGFLNDNFLKIGNKLAFRICLPSMLFLNVYEIRDLGAINWTVAWYSVVMILVIFLLGLPTAMLTTSVPERRGVILQCTFRSNFAIIGLSLAGTLGGAESLAMGAVLSAVSIPTFNILAVIALTMFLDSDGSKGGKLKGILLNILKNPLIIGVALGLICVLIREIQKAVFGEVVFALNKQGKIIYSILGSLKAIASPLALLVLGGQFVFSAVKNLWKEITVGIVWRVILAPLIGIGVAYLLSRYTPWFQCGPNEYPSLIALFGTPAAFSTAVMAGAMHNDEQLATQLVVWTSLVSVVTIFLLVFILMAAGLVVA